LIPPHGFVDFGAVVAILRWQSHDGLVYFGWDGRLSENGLLAHSHHWSKASFIGASRNGPSLGESWGLGEGVLCAFGQF